MQDIDSQDFIVEILQDIIEIESTAKILKSSVDNMNAEISINDIVNFLEIFVAKINNAKHSLDKYIDIVYR